MFRRHRLTAAAPLALLAAATLALAHAPSAATSASAGKAQGDTNLSPIVVNGQNFPLPLALQLIKKGLASPWSTAPDDRYKIVCRVRHSGSILTGVLHCATNAAHFHMHEGLISSGGAERTLTNAGLAMQLGHWVNNHVTNVGELRSTLARLPPPGSSYTLRLVGGHQQTVEYVVKKGKLVAKYVVEHGKPVLVWSRKADAGDD